MITNVLEHSKLLPKGETVVKQGKYQRKTNKDIIKLKHNINKTVYSTHLKDTLQEKLKSEVKWTKYFQTYDISWEMAYQMSHR